MDTRQKSLDAEGDVVGLLLHFCKIYPIRTATVVLLLSLAGLMEGVSILSVLPLLDLSIPKEGGSSSHAIQWLSSGVEAIGLQPSLGVWLSICVSGIALKAGITLLAMKEAGYAVARLMTELRQRLVAALLAARWSYYVSKPLGVFANALGAETMRAGASYQQAARLTSSVIQGLVYTLLTLLVSWQTAVFALVAGLAAVALFRKAVAGAQLAGSHQTELMRSLSMRVTDTLQGIKAVKAMAAENLALPLIAAEIRGLDANQRRQVWLSELLRVGQEPVVVIFLAAGLYGAVEFGRIPLSALMVMAVLFYRLVNRLQVVQEIYQAMALTQSAYWSMHRMVADLVSEGEDALGQIPAPSTVPRLKLESVGYIVGGRSILQNISLDVAPGELVVISGASGVGKTTLLDLLGGLLQPSEGYVSVDGMDVRTLDLRSWRKQIGYVPQEMLLLHDTIHNNVTLGDESISATDVELALQSAGVWSEVMTLPEGLRTVMGERGTRFSGGQRQRISLARALVRRPSVLLLDEITASLDEASEQAVCKTLRGLAGKMTIVAVSHQKALAHVANRCVCLQHGMLVTEPC